MHSWRSVIHFDFFNFKFNYHPCPISFFKRYKYKNSATWSGSSSQFRDLSPVLGACFLASSLNQAQAHTRGIWRRHNGLFLFWLLNRSSPHDFLALPILRKERSYSDWPLSLESRSLDLCSRLFYTWHLHLPVCIHFHSGLSFRRPGYRRKQNSSHCSHLKDLCWRESLCALRSRHWQQHRLLSGSGHWELSVSYPGLLRSLLFPLIACFLLHLFPSCLQRESRWLNGPSLSHTVIFWE